MGMEIIQGLGMLATFAWLIWARRDLAGGWRDLSATRRSARLRRFEESIVLRRHPFANSDPGNSHHRNTSA
jgi:hypothetical protein